jgi:predicted peptidase
LALATWCRDKGLFFQAIRHARMILRADAKHADAKALIAACVAKAKSKERGLLRNQTVPGYDDPNAWYHVWVPPNHAAERPMPLYIFLHGGGIDAGSANDVIAFQQIVPELTANISLFPNHMHSRWSHPKEMIYLLDILDEVMLHFTIDPTRIYIMGGSMGGTGTFAMAANFPEIFAACAPNSSWWEYIPIEQAVVMPIYIVHGSQDGTVPVKWGRDAYAKLKDLPGAKVEYHELDCGHQPPYDSFKAATKWISQFTNPRTFDLEELKARCRKLPPPPWAASNQ